MRWNHEGVEIKIEEGGAFVAKVGDALISKRSLADAKEAVHTAVVASMRARQTQVPVFILGKHAESVVYRGVSAKDGSVLVITKAGKKDSIDVPYDDKLGLLAPDSPLALEAQALVDEAEAIDRRMQEITKRLAKIRTENAADLSGDGRYIQNDVARALSRHLKVVAKLEEIGLVPAPAGAAR